MAADAHDVGRDDINWHNNDNVLPNGWMVMEMALLPLERR